MNPMQAFIAELAPMPDDHAEAVLVEPPGLREPCTYIGAGGLIEVKVQAGARAGQLRLASQFIELLMELEARGRQA